MKFNCKKALSKLYPISKNAAACVTLTPQKWQPQFFSYLAGPKRSRAQVTKAAEGNQGVITNPAYEDISSLVNGIMAQNMKGFLW